jgi:uncharacterized protein YfkK (UPF0435 family)
MIKQQVEDCFSQIRLLDEAAIAEKEKRSKTAYDLISLFEFIKQRDNLSPKNQRRR